jgi:hypothetical protein
MSKGLLAILAMAKQIAKSANEQRSIGNLGYAKQIAKSANEQRSIGNLGNGKTNYQSCQ